MKDTDHAHGQPTTPRRLEWPTLGLAALIYAGWFAATGCWRMLPGPLLFLVGGWVIAWHSSLQHETIHGHPSRSRRFNDALGWAPLSLWLPYASYRDSHMRHHRAERLTDPAVDPESGYLGASAWRRAGPLQRALARFDSTLAGRLGLGTVRMILGVLAEEFLAALRGRPGRRRRLAAHLLGVVAVLAWLRWCELPLWLYVAAFVLPGAALTRLRAFAEHRWHERPELRTTIVESRLFGLLFLHNNLHVLHHRHPAAPWYRLPGLYRQWPVDPQVRVYRGYREVARRYLWRGHDSPWHPAEHP